MTDKHVMYVPPSVYDTRRRNWVRIASAVQPDGTLTDHEREEYAQSDDLIVAMAQDCTTEDAIKWLKNLFFSWQEYDQQMCQIERLLALSKAIVMLRESESADD